MRTDLQIAEIDIQLPFFQLRLIQPDRERFHLITQLRQHVIGIVQCVDNRTVHGLIGCCIFAVLAQDSRQILNGLQKVFAYRTDRQQQNHHTDYQQEHLHDLEQNHPHDVPIRIDLHLNTEISIDIGQLIRYPFLPGTLTHLALFLQRELGNVVVAVMNQPGQEILLRDPGTAHKGVVHPHT